MEISNYKTITFIGLRPGLLEKAAVLASAFHAWLRANGSRAMLVDERQGGGLRHHEDAPDLTVIIAEQAPAAGAVVWTLTFAEARNVALAEQISARAGACCAVVDVDEKFPFLSGLRARAAAAWNETPFIEMPKFSPQELMEALSRGEYLDMQSVLAELMSSLELTEERKAPNVAVVKKTLSLNKAPTADAGGAKSPAASDNEAKAPVFNEADFQQRVDLLAVAKLIGFSLPDMYRRPKAHAENEDVLSLLADKTADDVNHWVNRQLLFSGMTTDRRRHLAIALLILLDGYRKKGVDNPTLYHNIDRVIPETDKLLLPLRRLNGLLGVEVFIGKDNTGMQEKLEPFLRAASAHVDSGEAGIIDTCVFRLAALTADDGNDRERYLDLLQQAGERLPADEKEALGLRSFFAVNSIRLKMKDIL